MSVRQLVDCLNIGRSQGEQTTFWYHILNTHYLAKSDRSQRDVMVVPYRWRQIDLKWIPVLDRNFDDKILLRTISQELRAPVRVLALFTAAQGLRDLCHRKVWEE